MFDVQLLDGILGTSDSLFTVGTAGEEAVFFDH